MKINFKKSIKLIVSAIVIVSVVGGVCYGITFLRYGKCDVVEKEQLPVDRVLKEEQIHTLDSIASIRIQDYESKNQKGLLDSAELAFIDSLATSIARADSIFRLNRDK